MEIVSYPQKEQKWRRRCANIPSKMLFWKNFDILKFSKMKFTHISSLLKVSNIFSYSLILITGTKQVTRSIGSRFDQGRRVNLLSVKIGSPVIQVTTESIGSPSQVSDRINREILVEVSDRFTYFFVRPCHQK